MLARNAPIDLFNSLGRELQEFQSIRPGRVHLYTCGLTVYNYAHLGNLRAYLFTDTLRRVLQWKGYDVLHVMNITDVGHLTSDQDEGDDKVETAAARTGRSVWDITNYYTQDFQDNLGRLNVLPPSVWCKATDHIQEMIEFARVIERGDYTYILDDGLYFDTSRVADYGRLGALDLEGQRAGARVEMKSGKRNPSDFVLWRSSPPDKQRLMEWRSPWGIGAPGWHLECSVMSIKYLGAPFDIHTGGVDHRQIHHCNEIAQNQAYLASEHGGVNYWLHNEFLLLGEARMAKSRGDFLRLQTLLDWGIHPLVYRHFNLMTHYRSQLDFSMGALISSRTGLERVLRRVEALRSRAQDARRVDVLADVRFGRGARLDWVVDQLSDGLSKRAESLVAEFDKAISNDLNTPQAMALLYETMADKQLSADECLRLIGIFDLALGLDLTSLSPEALNMRPKSATLEPHQVDEMIEQRTQARRSKDFKRADAIRQELEQAGVLAEDGSDGVTRWSWLPRAGA